MSLMLTNAIIVAATAHGEAKDKAGMPYIFHPLRVLEAARFLGLDEESQVIAVLHDVVEDTNVTLADLRRMGFPETVISGVDALTRRYDHPNYETYFQFVERASMNNRARRVKMLDNADNMRPERRVEGLKLVGRYPKALGMLEEMSEAVGDTDFLFRFKRYVTWI